MDAEISREDTMGTDRSDVPGQNKKTGRWRGDLVAGLYDWIMVHSVFPGKFHAGYEKHCRIIEEFLNDIHGEEIIEVGTGSGFTAPYIPHDNKYTGTDISPNLLKKAERRFAGYGFTSGDNAGFTRAPGESLPFPDSSFSYAICLLTFNFISGQAEALKELHRVLKQGSRALFCVPCPERLLPGVKIQGKLHTGEELRDLSREAGFSYEESKAENGALLYFHLIREYM